MSRKSEVSLRRAVRSLPLDRFAEKTIVDPDRLLDELRAVRSRDGATSDEELVQGVVGCAVPVLAPDGTLVVGLGVSVPVARVDRFDIPASLPRRPAKDQRKRATMPSEHYDVDAIRREFPVTKHMLYLDSAHQTPLATSVREALVRFYDEGHEFGGPKPMWMRRVEKVRERLAGFLGAEPTEIAFTKNTSEGLNIAANALPLKAGDVVLMVEGDHPNNGYAFMNLRRKGIEVRFVPLTGETADASTFEPHVDSNTKAISLSHVTFHAGERFDVNGIGKLCAEKGLWFVVDSMQSIGVVPLDVKEVGATFLASGTHKGMLVPQGLGILYCKGDAAGMEPAYMAMSSLSNPPEDYIARHENTALRAGAGRFEIGNFNLPDIHALGAALDLINRVGVANLEAHLYDLGDRLVEHLDHQGIRLVGPRTRSARAPHIYVLDLKGQDWLDYLANQNVRVSPERDGIRISFGMFNTLGEVDQVADIIKRRGKTGVGIASAAELVD